MREGIIDVTPINGIGIILDVDVDVVFEMASTQWPRLAHALEGIAAIERFVAGTFENAE